MLKKHYTVRFTVIFFVIIFAAIYILIVRSKRCHKLDCISFNGYQTFKIKQIYQDEGSVFRALLERGNDLLRVDITSSVTQEQTNRLIQTRIAKMKALFENATSPYPGEISGEIVCDKRFKPTFTSEGINGIPVSYFTGYLNSRLTYGACTEDQAVNKGIMTLFYCPAQEKMYQLELISEKDRFIKNEAEYLGIIRSIQCKS